MKKISLFLMAFLFLISTAHAKNQILVLMDSHGLGPFGETLETWLFENGDADLSFYALGGANVEWWFKRQYTPRGYIFLSKDGGKPLHRTKYRDKPEHAPMITDVLRDLSSRVSGSETVTVVIEQGSNAPMAYDYHAKAAQKLLEAVYEARNVRCLWIAPPHMTKIAKDKTEASSEKFLNKIFESIQKAITDASKNKPKEVADCALFDSRLYTQYPGGGDGIHYPATEKGYMAVQKWIKAFTEAFQKL